MKAQVAKLEEKNRETKRLWVEAEKLAREKEDELSKVKAELQKTKKCHKSAIYAKDTNIGGLEEKLCLAKYSRVLWAKDQTFLLYLEVAPFF